MQVAPILPHERIGVALAVSSFAVGMSLVAPLVFLLACLPLPQADDGGSAQQRRHVDYVNQTGALFLKAVVFFPLVEEAFYRGLVFPLLRRRAPTWVAAGFSAAFFAVTHLGQGAATALNAFLLGCFFAWLVAESYSLVPAILCHAGFNFSWLFVTIPWLGLGDKIEQRATGDPLNPLQIFPVWWMMMSIGALAWGLIVLKRELVRKAQARNLISESSPESIDGLTRRCS